jgi:hypothetical protein
MSAEVQELIFRADTSGIKQADAALTEHQRKTLAVRRELDELNAAWQRGAVHNEVYQRELKRLTRSLDDVDRAAGGGSMLSGRRGGGGASLAMMQLGRSVQDFQAAGLYGITNNIEGLAMALGLGGGLAGVATLAFVALQAFGPELSKLIGQTNETRTFADEIDRLNAEIKDLGKQKNPSIEVKVETEEAKRQLKELQEGAELLQATLTGQTAEEQASGKAFLDALGTPEAREAVNTARRRYITRAALPHRNAVSELSRQVAAQEWEISERRFNMTPEEGLSASAKLRGLKEQLATEQNAAAAAERNADLAFGAIERNAIKGTGQAQADAQASFAATVGGTQAELLRLTMGMNTPEAQFARRQRKREDENARRLKAQQEKIAKEREAGAQEFEGAEWDRITAEAEASGRATARGQARFRKEKADAEEQRPKDAIEFARLQLEQQQAAASLQRLPFETAARQRELAGAIESAQTDLNQLPAAVRDRLRGANQGEAAQIRIDAAQREMALNQRILDLTGQLMSLVQQSQNQANDINMRMMQQEQKMREIMSRDQRFRQTFQQRGRQGGGN